MPPWPSEQPASESKGGAGEDQERQGDQQRAAGSGNDQGEQGDHDEAVAAGAGERRRGGGLRSGPTVCCHGSFIDAKRSSLER